MRPPYISLFALVCTLVLSGCSGMPNPSKDPNSLASRVGNFSPVKLNAENAERKAAKFVTPLAKGTRDLDGRQENFDPAFGSPETEAEAARLNAQDLAEHAKLNANQNVSAVNQAANSPDKAPLPQGSAPFGHAETRSGQTPVLRPDSTDSSEFGKSQNGRTTVFMETPAKQPIIESSPVSPARGISQGFGCPPAGVGSVQSMRQGSMQPQRQGSMQAQRLSSPQIAMSQMASPQMSSPQTSSPQSGSSQMGSHPSPRTSPGSGRHRASVGVHPQVLSRQPAQLQTPAMLSQPVTNRPSPQQQQVMLFRTPPQAPPERKNILMGQAPGANYEGPSASASTYEPAGMDSTDDLSLVTAQNQRAKNVRITATARVRRVLPDDRKGNPHQRFLLGLSNGTTVLVAHNIDLAPYVPLQQGDSVTICGEYIWNEKGGVLHYTHHTTNSHHQGGYIQYNRQTYQ